MGDVVDFAARRAERAEHPVGRDLVDPDKMRIIVPTPVAEELFDALGALLGGIVDYVTEHQLDAPTLVRHAQRVSNAGEAYWAQAEQYEQIGD